MKHEVLNCFSGVCNSGRVQNVVLVGLLMGERKKALVLSLRGTGNKHSLNCLMSILVEIKGWVGVFPGHTYNLNLNLYLFYTD